MSRQKLRFRERRSDLKGLVDGKREGAGEDDGQKRGRRRTLKE